MNRNNAVQFFFGLVLTPNLAQVLTLNHIPLFSIDWILFRLSPVKTSEQTPIYLKYRHKSIQNQTKKKKYKNTKKAFIVYFPPPEIQPPCHLQNPFTTSLPNQHQKTISQYPHVSSHQKVTRQPKPFDPTTNKPHLSILTTSGARL